MTHRIFGAYSLALTLVLLGACADSGGDQGTGGSSTAGCGAKVTIAFYSDAECTEANKAGQRAYDTGLECFSWEGGANADGNSVTRFQCYNDRICYTQHPNT